MPVGEGVHNWMRSFEDLCEYLLHVAYDIHEGNDLGSNWILSWLRGSNWILSLRGRFLVWAESGGRGVS